MNIVEFSKMAGVSTATVSRAFHEPEKLTPATRDRILKLAHRLGYYPNPAGRVLVRGRYDALGVIWPLEVEGTEAPFPQRILSALTQHLVKNDLDLLICPVNRQLSSNIAHARRTLQRSRCDAWLLLYPRPCDILIEPLRGSHKPVVCLMGSIPECPEWKSVQLDQESWMGDALRRLRKAFCRKVALFGIRPGEPDHEHRQKAFLKLAPAYFKGATFIVPGGLADPTQLRQHLLTNQIDAIIGADDAAALLALAVCRDVGLAVPQQVRVVGIDDAPQASTSFPPLSTYRQPLDEMLACAVELALGQRKRSSLFAATFISRATLPA